MSNGAPSRSTPRGVRACSVVALPQLASAQFPCTQQPPTYGNLCDDDHAITTPHSSCWTPGPCWEERWRDVFTGREVRRVVDGKEQVGVVMHRVREPLLFVLRLRRLCCFA